MKAHVLYLCALSSAIIYSADARSFLYPNSWGDTLPPSTEKQSFEAESQVSLFLETPALNNSYKTAGVYFITNDKGQKFSSIGNGGENGSEFDDPTGEYCARYGFEVTSCASGLFNKACPYNDKIYDKCCDASYKYTASQCSYPKKLSSDTCGGKYKCLCDTSYYSYTYCDSPKVKGSACTDDSGTYYSSCSCPTGVSAPYGCETYYATPCNTVCQKAYTDNCRNRESVQTPYGCEKYFADCSSKCEKAYTDNCRNRTAVSAPHGCESYYADCSSKCEVAKIDNCANKTAVSAPYGCKKTFDDCPSKCEVAYTDNCHNRTAVSASYGCISYFADCSSKCEKAYTDNCRNRTAVDSSAYGCQKYFADCSSKCEKAYADNCRNRTAVSIPSTSKGICVSYYEDCPSKCSAWGCKENQAIFIDKLTSGKTNQVCKNIFPILYGDGTVSYKILSDKTPIGVVIDEDKHVAIGLTNIKEDGTITLEKVVIASSQVIEVCRKFEPEGCISDFCKRGNWELPIASQLYSITIQSKKNEFTRTIELLNVVNEAYRTTTSYGNTVNALVCDEETSNYYSRCKDNAGRITSGPVRPVIHY